MDYVVEILADSVGPHEVRLTTFHLVYPRAAVHEDFLTHRDFSRNASSSRAIPITRMLERADWRPEVFGQHRAGMGVDRAATNQDEAARIWTDARRYAHRAALDLAAIGVAKEDANLLLRPFEWIDVVVTATRWRHFFGLRGSGGNARKQVQRVADGMRDLLTGEDPDYLQPGMWHLPYVDTAELAEVCVGRVDRLTAAHASAMRCARTSYARHDGTHGTLEEDADACEARLVVPGHWSPLEHAAQCIRLNDDDQAPIREIEDWGNFDPGWLQLRKLYPGEYDAAPSVKENRTP